MLRMALTVSMTDAVGKILKPGMRVASMGYPDIIAPIYMIERILGDKMAGIIYRGDSEAICTRHGIEQRLIPDAESFFDLMGCKLTVYDVVKERGCEVICDLNKRLDPILRAFNYDMVLDVGTMEHCFNIAQAAFNMAGMLKHGGIIIHDNPFNMGNHGFYGMNPTWYSDFYSANGFTLLECRLSKAEKGAPVPQTKRFTFLEMEASVFAVARRDEVKRLVFPVQSKYANKIPAANAAPVAGVSGEQLREVANG